MKYSKWRTHKVNLDTKYEGLEFGFSVSFDTETDKLPPEYNGKFQDEIYVYLEDELDEALAMGAQRAVDSGAVEDSYLFDYYQIKH